LPAASQLQQEDSHWQYSTTGLWWPPSAGNEQAMNMDVPLIQNPPELIATKTAAVRRAILTSSPHVRQGNFTAIATDDLQQVFNHYDRHFFGGWLARNIAEKSPTPLSFRLSRTMTRAGGKTIARQCLEPNGQRVFHYEIAISSTLLFMTFGDVQRPVIVCGVPCADRLQALQLIMEHEIVHLIELLVWGRSSCAADQYKALAARIFGHTASSHELVTPREHAAIRHNIHVGSMVEFDFEGPRRIGRVNRISPRATVQLPSADGVPYSDGHS
jgi:hypothetical protein